MIKNFTVVKFGLFYYYDSIKPGITPNASCESGG